MDVGRYYFTSFPLRTMLSPVTYVIPVAWLGEERNNNS